MEAIEDIGDLRDQVLEYLKALGFEINLDAPQSLTLFSEEKAYLRQLHEKARRFALKKHQLRIRRSWSKLSPYFARGDQVVPERIRPVLLEVNEPWQEDLFFLARLTWSLPYSKGYGRRLRFLIPSCATS